MLSGGDKALNYLWHASRQRVENATNLARTCNVEIREDLRPTRSGSVFENIEFSRAIPVPDHNVTTACEAGPLTGGGNIHHVHTRERVSREKFPASDH